MEHRHKIILQMPELLFVVLIYEISAPVVKAEAEAAEVKIVEDAEIVVQQWLKGN